jgi:hypothetical protein
MSDTTGHYAGCEKITGKGPFCTCPPLQPPQEMASLTAIKAALARVEEAQQNLWQSLGAVERKVDNLQQTVDVLRQSTLGLLIEEVRVLDGRVMAIGNALGDIVAALTKHKKPRPKRRKGHS